MNASFRIGIDVGGTFTDVVSIDTNGLTTFAKAPSTPRDQSIGVIEGLKELARRHRLGLRDLLSRTERVVHGTTVATNALLERKGAKVGLLTTSGHRDVLEMREGLKDHRYDLRSTPPQPLVARQLRFGVIERLRSDGSVVRTLDRSSLGKAIDSLKAANVASVAICYLHSYKNAVHEIQTAEMISQALPGVFISRSSDVLPQIKEYERVSTTVVNAYVGPLVQRYLKNLQLALKTEGLFGSLFIILSHGGIAPVEEAGRLSAATVLSGPAGGVAGSRRCSELLGLPNLIPFDVGGTSTDVSLICGGNAALTSERGLANQRIALRALDIASIAAGGGSIASVDAGGRFRVGPESAGAAPGPACYGNGGMYPTVTDANLLLGYLDEHNFLGGRKILDRKAAEQTVDLKAEELNLSRNETALGIYRLINLKMADGIRLVTLRRGLDPRKFVLLAFGGAAGLHAAEVARELEIPRIVVPTMASVLSAWGMLASDLRYEISRTHLNDTGIIDDGGIRKIFAELEQAAVAKLNNWTESPVRIERSVEMRYGEQIFEVDVGLDNLSLSSPNLASEIEERFHKRHEELYTYASRGQEVVLVNARVAAIGTITMPASTISGAPSQQSTKERYRKAYLDGWREVPVVDIGQVEPGMTFEGPAIFESETTTVIANYGDRVSINEFGWLDISLRKQN